MPIEFQVNPNKIIEAILYILEKSQRRAKSIFILKCLYYADKFSLQKYAFPVTGDTYIKLKHGPCAHIAYDILKQNDPYLSEDILAASKNAFTMYNNHNIGDYNTTYRARRKANTNVFSDSDIECLDKSISYCSSYKTDFSLSKQSHKEKAWLQAAYKTPMQYELMIDDNTEYRSEIIEYLHGHSRSLCL